MVCLIHQDQFEVLRMELHHAIARSETPDGSDCNIGSASSMGASHFDFNGLVWIGIGTMPSCLLDKFPPMNKYERLRGMGI